MLAPKRYKYGNGKQFKGRNKGVATRANRVRFGDFGLQSTQLGFLTQRQIESARIAISRYIKRGGKIWITIFPDKSITKKPLEVRQGKGKGSVEYWVAPVQPGRVLYEISGVDKEQAKEAMRRASAKLPFKTRFIERVLRTEQ